MVSKTLLNGYDYTRPLLVLQGDTPTPRSSTSRWPWSPHPSRGSKAWRASQSTRRRTSRRRFVDNFQESIHDQAGAYESIRSYVKRFFDTRATIPNVIDDDVIDYFQSGITVQSLYRDFGRNRPKTVVELRGMMQRWADEEEQERSCFPRRNNNNGKRHNDRGGPSNQRDPTRKRKPDDTVGTMDRTPRGTKGDKPQDQFDKILHNKKMSNPPQEQPLDMGVHDPAQILTVDICSYTKERTRQR